MCISNISPEKQNTNRADNVGQSQSAHKQKGAKTNTKTQNTGARMKKQQTRPVAMVPSILTSSGLPPDAILVGVAGGILVGIGLLQRSLGDIMQEEAQLPPAAGAAARRQSQRSKRFLKRNHNKPNKP